MGVLDRDEEEYECRIRNLENNVKAMKELGIVESNYMGENIKLHPQIVLDEYIKRKRLQEFADQDNNEKTEQKKPEKKQDKDELRDFIFGNPKLNKDERGGIYGF